MNNRRLPVKFRFFPGILALLLFAPVGMADEEDVREALRTEIENITLGIPLTSGVEVAAASILSGFYERRSFSPAWRDAGQVTELLAAIEASEADGLDPDDYFLAEVQDARNVFESGENPGPVRAAVTDILLTESLIRLGYHERFGKVNPYTLDPNWNFRRDLGGVDPVEAVETVIDSPSLTGALQEFFPRGWSYRLLRDALAEYRRIESEGGWPAIPDGPTLRPGDADERLHLLAQRLIITGDLPADTQGPYATYDDRVEAGVRRFQVRHALDVDGVIGPATWRALNVPVSQRVMQLELSLERSRWITDDLEGDFILVNIAAFRAYVVRNHEAVWESRVQVGRPYRQTPVFRDEMRYLVFNPTWTAPFSIATRDILPRIQQDRSYLTTQGIDVKDRNGNLVDPALVDWQNLSRRSFPYTLVQRPGPYNAMGRIKFMFPNRFAVYLHDTPSRSLFESADRTFSAGCIRVAKPLELAEELLRVDGWDQQRIQEVLESGEIKTVSLSQPLPVFLLYWTAEIDADGLVYFYTDVYERDRAIADALDEPFRLDPPGEGP
jgi:murein L,D-transpeptidase YcbB/YkuD